MDDSPDPQLASLSRDEIEARLATAVTAGNRAARATRFARYQPLAFQREWFQDEFPISVLVLPNRVGKTTTGAIKTLSGCLGWTPTSISGTPAPRSWTRGALAGKRFLAAGASFKKITTETILPKLKHYISDEMILGSKKTQGFETEFRFVTGATLILKSYEQKVKDFEGGEWAGAWFDEPPPQDIFGATRRGQVDSDTDGWAIITATPLSEPWMIDDLILPASSRDCLECSGGDVPHAEIVEAQPNHGSVFVPYQQLEMHDNCRECHGGYLSHQKILQILAEIQDEGVRRARQYGEFMNFSKLEFGYVNELDNVVDDFKPPASWQVIEVVDPAPKRGLHIKWYCGDRDDRWYNTHAARIPSDGGFRKMASEIQRWRQVVGRQPDVALMDPRGGHHQHVTAKGREDWFTGFRNEGVVYVPAIAGYENSGIETLHDWLKPTLDPSKTDQAVPRLRFCRRLKVMEKGPLWAYERFVWNPMDSTRRKWEQPAKDFVDCDIYLAMWVEKHKLSHRKYEAQDRPPPRAGIAASYESSAAPGRSQQSARDARPPWAPRLSIGRSNSARMAPQWTDRIKGYS